MSNKVPLRTPSTSCRADDIAAQYDNHGNKIRRPMNAFMLFANENRSLLRQQMGATTNQMVSVRLGEIWNSMSEEAKTVYFLEAKQGEREHAVRYPDYRYLPSALKECRMEKQEDIHKRLKKQFEKQRRFRMLLEECIQERQVPCNVSTKRYMVKPSIFQLRRPEKEASVYESPVYMTGHRSSQDHRRFPQRSTDGSHADRSYTNTYMSAIEEECQQAIANIPNQDPIAVPQPAACVPDPQPEVYRHAPEPSMEGFNNRVSSIPPGYNSVATKPDTGQGDVPTNPDNATYKPSGDTSKETELSPETNYVMIPCDVNVARMLGWPVHVLQPVSQQLLEELQAEATRPTNIASDPGCQPETAGLQTDSPTSILQNTPDESQLNDNHTNQSALDLSVKRRRLMDDKMIRKSRKCFRSDSQLDVDKDKLQIGDSQNISNTAIPSEAVKLQQSVCPTQYSRNKNRENVSFKYGMSEASGPGSKFLQPYSNKPRGGQLVPAAVGGDASSVAHASVPEKTKKALRNEFQVFQLGDGDTDSLENIDTSTITESFGQLNSEDIAAYRSAGSQEDKDWRL